MKKAFITGITGQDGSYLADLLLSTCVTTDRPRFTSSNPGKAIRTLNWQPRVCFKDLVRIMVDADLELLGLASPGEGRRVLENCHGSWHRWDSQVVSMGNNGSNQE